MNMTENGGVVEVSDTTWERAIERGTLPAVVMFYSETCPFCKQIEPYFRQFAGEFGEKLLFARLNVSENPWTIERYAVRQTPTFKFFCTGKPVQEIIGAAFAQGGGVVGDHRIHRAGTDPPEQARFSETNDVITIFERGLGNNPNAIAGFDQYFTNHRDP